MLPCLLALSICVVPPTAASPQTLGDAMATIVDRVEAYPPQPPRTRTLSFLIEPHDEIASVVKALASLGTPDARCRVVGEPEKSPKHPKVLFLVVEAPVAIEAKEIVATLRKASRSADRLACTAFDAEPGMFGAGTAPRRAELLSSASEVQWASSWGRSYQIYTAPGKVRAKQLAARLAKAVGSKTGLEVAQHSFTWKLVEPVDVEAAKRAEKLLAALPGVVSARVDVTSGLLEVKVTFEGLDALGPAYEVPVSEGSKAGGTKADVVFTLPIARFDTTPVFAALEREKLAVAPPSKGGK
jgi:hypothetical protein